MACLSFKAQNPRAFRDEATTAFGLFVVAGVAASVDSAVSSCVSKFGIAAGKDALLADLSFDAQNPRADRDAAAVFTFGFVLLDIGVTGDIAAGVDSAVSTTVVDSCGVAPVVDLGIFSGVCFFGITAGKDADVAVFPFEANDPFGYATGAAATDASVSSVSFELGVVDCSDATAVTDSAMASGFSELVFFPVPHHPAANFLTW